MKKNLRIVLALTLGLATTAHAQDWSVDSRTRVNSTEDATRLSKELELPLISVARLLMLTVEFNSNATLGNMLLINYSV